MKMKRRKACVSWVSRLPATKPNIRWTSARMGDGRGAKFSVLTQGDLSASAAHSQAVAVEDERTRWQWDERSRMTARYHKAGESRL